MKFRSQIVLIVIAGSLLTACIDATAPRLPDAGDDAAGDTSKGDKRG